MNELVEFIRLVGYEGNLSTFSALKKATRPFCIHPDF